ncbi:hypothetical protein [Clostridium sp.]|uniref:hypothetical protein n=1 Tax=Clostridium sp. TaxID=1506 RepID=UPI001A3C675D|nr:hypothetical protein [Clostridium sp.]MBK5234055.1 hypothetical protein [Clostridium sp.]
MATLIKASDGKGGEGVSGKYAMCSSRVYPANVKTGPGANIYMYCGWQGYGLNMAGTATVKFYGGGVLLKTESIAMGYDYGVLHKSFYHTITDNPYTDFQIVCAYSSSRVEYQHDVSMVAYTEDA